MHSKKHYDAVVAAKELIGGVVNFDLEEVITVLPCIIGSKKVPMVDRIALVAVLTSGAFDGYWCNGWRISQFSMPSTADVLSNYAKVRSLMKRHPSRLYVNFVEVGTEEVVAKLRFV